MSSTPSPLTGLCPYVHAPAWCSKHESMCKTAGLTDSALQRDCVRATGMIHSACTEAVSLAESRLIDGSVCSLVSARLPESMRDAGLQACTVAASTLVKGVDPAKSCTHLEQVVFDAVKGRLLK